MAVRLYSLYEKGKDGKWFRCTPLEFPKNQAVRYFQSKLLAYYLGPEACGMRELKPVSKTVGTGK